MNKIMTIALSGMLMLSVAAPTFAQEDPKKETLRKKRMENQQKRIEEGRKSGELTKREVIKLETKEAALAKEAREQRKDGGGMTKREKAKINHQQDKISKQIYDEKHDAQKKKQ